MGEWLSGFKTKSLARPPMGLKTKAMAHFSKLLLPSPPPELLKLRRGYWWEPAAVRLTRSKWLMLRLQQHWRQEKLRRSYEELASPTLPSGNYVVLALPSWPEGSTLPAALWYRSPELLLRNLLENLPESVTVLVKAHPVQFASVNFWTTMPGWRNKAYYRNLVAIGGGRVRLASLRLNQQDLIDNSLGVAVINGTLGMEALCRGKSVIHTASAHYEGLPGAHLCRTQVDFRKAVTFMISGKEVPLPHIQFSEAGSRLIDPSTANSGSDIEGLIELFVASLNEFERLGPEKFEP